jgi:response regulator of citrate/malate metabolism
MKKEYLVTLVLLIAAANFGMARSGQYDEDAREQEKVQKAMDKETQALVEHHPGKNFATGIKEMTVDNVKDTLGDTTHGTMSEKPVIGTLDGVRQSSDKVIDNTIKGVKKVASLGYAKDDSYEIEQPVEKSGEAAKIKLFKF